MKTMSVAKTASRLALFLLSAALAGSPRAAEPPAGSAVPAVQPQAVPTPSQDVSTINLHVHSYCSDGSGTPEQIVAAARAAGIRYLAVTDHDTTACVRRAQAAARQAGITLIPGIELSAEKDRMHILGVNIDVDNPAIQRMIQETRAARIARGRAMVDKLNKKEVDGRPIQLTFREVLVNKINSALAADGRPPLSEAESAGASEDALLARIPGPITSPDIVKLLVMKGYFKTMNQAYDAYKAPGSPIDVPANDIPFRTAIDAIHSAGGIALLPHPYTFWSKQKEKKGIPTAFSGKSYQNFEELERDLLTAGLDGFELYKDPKTASIANWIVNLNEASKFELTSGKRLLITPGSDYHGATGVGAAKLKPIVIPRYEADRILQALNIQRAAPAAVKAPPAAQPATASADALRASAEASLGALSAQ